MLATLLLQSVVPTPPIYINHFFVTLARPTWNAIVNDKWLKEQFAYCYKGTNSSGKDSWTGYYINGVSGYIELFGADGKEFKEGDCGIGLGTPMAGAADNVYANFRASAFGSRAQRDNMDLGTTKKQLPFAHIVSYDSPEQQHLNLWLMEFHQDFYARRHLPVGSTYEKVMTSYRNNKPYTRMMGEIRNIATQPVGDTKDLKLALPLFGFAQKIPNVFENGDDSISILPAKTGAKKYTITSVRLTLSHKPKSMHVERFSLHCSLTVHPEGYADWDFN
jgi:hypothetical protein